MTNTARRVSRLDPRRAGLLAFLATVSLAQHAGAEEPPALTPARASLLILGTFHFSDAGLDEFRPRHDVDILAEDRQREVSEVVRLLADFAPTKIAVEWPASQKERVDAQYRRYVDGAFELPSNVVPGRPRGR